MVDEKKLRLDRLEDEIDRQILEASDIEIVEDAIAAGDDPTKFAEKMNAWVQSAVDVVGKARLQQARAELEQERLKSSGKVVPFESRVSPRPPGFVPDTMAARLEKEISDKDKQAFDDDYDELFDDSAWGDDESDKDS